MDILFKKILVLVLSLGFFLHTLSQEIQYDISDSLTSIPISLIPDYQIDAEDAFFSANKFLSTIANTSASNKTTLNELISKTNNKVSVFDSIDITTLSASILDTWDRKWVVIEDEIKSVYNPINDNALLFEKEYSRLNSLYQLWLQTSIDIKNAKVPDDIKNSVISIKNEARNIRNKLKDDERTHLSLKQDYISLLNTVLLKRKLLVEARENIVANLLVAEHPVLWQSFTENDKIQNKESNKFEQILTNITNYAKTDYVILYIILSIFILFTFLGLFFKKVLKKEIAEGIIHEQVGVINLVIKQPLVVSLLLTWLVIAITLYIPIEIRSIIMLIMMIPVYILIRQFMGLQDVFTISLFVVYYLFLATKSLLFSNSIVIRITYLIIAIFSIIIVWYILKHKKYLKRFEKFGWFVKLVFYLEFLLFLASIFFYVAGNVTLASMLLSGAIMLVMVGIIFYSINKLIFSIVQYFFGNKFLQKSHIVQNHSIEIQTGIKKILSIVLFIYWALISIGGFGIKREILFGLREFYTHQYTLGSVTFGLNNIVSFIITIYASIWLSRFLLF